MDFLKTRTQNIGTQERNEAASYRLSVTERTLYSNLIGLLTVRYSHVKVSTGKKKLEENAGDLTSLLKTILR